MLGAINNKFCEYLLREKYDFVDKHGSELFYICTCTSGCKLVVLVVLCVHVPQVGSFCVHVPQVGGIVCTCTSGW